ncbi:hypothetical protein AB0J52_36080, partial [Spirillospora sp. NPDC049652]
HVASCPTCAAQSVPDIPADQVLGSLPIAALPADLRLDVLNAAASPGRADARRSAAALIEPLDPDGWPAPYRPRRSKRGRRARTEPLAAPIANPAPGAAGDADRTQPWNAEQAVPEAVDDGRPGRTQPDVLAGPGPGAPDTTLSFDAIPGTDTASAPPDGPSQGHGPAGGGGRHSRDAAAAGGEQLEPRRSGRVPEEGDRWVAGELRSPRGRKRAVLAGVGGVAAVAVLGVAVSAFAGGGGGGGHVAKGGRPAAPAPTGSVVEPTMSSAASPSASPTLHAKKGPSASPSRTPSSTPSSSSSSPAAPPASPNHSPTRRPTHSAPPAPPRPPRPGTLSVVGCSIGLGDSCQITVSASGGTVSWRVVGVSRGLSASGGGTLSAGQSATVQVRRQSMCWGSRTGQVVFSPSGTASVSFC